MNKEKRWKRKETEKKKNQNGVKKWLFLLYFTLAYI
jgi:hypothetical protein